MKYRRIVLSLPIVLFGVPTVRAQVTLDAAKINCKEFLLGKFGASTTSVANWLNGYYHGKAGTTIVETRSMSQNGDKLARFCRKNPDMAVMEAAKNALGMDK
jgi:acid stress chaperone HdeB